MKVIIYSLDESENLFPVDPVELYKFCLKTRLPKEAIEHWINSLREEDKVKIEEFRKEISDVVLSIGVQPQKVFSETGLQIVKGVLEGVIKT